MKKLMIGLALLSANAFIQGENTNSCSCTQQPGQACSFADCCAGFKVCVCDQCNLTCPDSTGGAVALSVCRTNETACVRVTVDGDKEHAIFANGTNNTTCNVTCASNGDFPDNTCPAPLTPPATSNNIVICVSGLAAGPHTFDVAQDCPSCSQTVTATITAPAPIVVKCKKTVCDQNNAATGPNGSAVVCVNGGTPFCSTNCIQTCPTDGSAYTVTAATDGTTSQCTVVAGTANNFLCPNLSCKSKNLIVAVDCNGCTGTTFVKVPCCKAKSCSDDKHHKKHSKDKKHSSKDKKHSKDKKSEKARAAKKAEKKAAKKAERVKSNSADEDQEEQAEEEQPKKAKVAKAIYAKKGALIAAAKARKMR